MNAESVNNINKPCSLLPASVSGSSSCFVSSFDTVTIVACVTQGMADGINGLLSDPVIGSNILKGDASSSTSEELTEIDCEREEREEEEDESSRR